MKKLVLFVAVMLMAAPAMALIAGSAHDFPATQGGVVGTDEICVYCHTPHGASASGPLWNRNDSATVLTGVYSSGTLNVSPSSDYTAIDAALCMSCHDGSQNINELLNPPNAGATISYTIGVGNPALFDSDMSNDHPVNFDYTTSSSDAEIVDYATLTGGGFPGAFGAGNLMQCSTCHDVHNTTVGGMNLLVVDNAGSGLCLECHIK